MPTRFAFERYDPQSLQKLSEKQLRAEYSRLRSIARKRLERLGESEFSDTAAYRLNRNKYVPLVQIKNKSQLVNKLSALEAFLNARSSTVRGARGIETERIATLHEHGYTWVNKANLKEFGEFMQFLKARYPHVPSADEQELRALFRGYKVIRQQAISAEQVQTVFDRWQSEHRPDSYYLRPRWQEVPREVQRADLPEGWDL